MLITSDVIKHNRFLGKKVDTFRRIPMVKLEHKYHYTVLIQFVDRHSIHRLKEWFRWCIFRTVRDNSAV